MSKIFDELERLESVSSQTPAVRPAALPPPSPVKPLSLKPPAIRPEESFIPQRIVQKLPSPIAAPEPPRHGGSVQAFAFDTAMVLVALAVFIAICFALGSANIVDLTHSSPWLAIVPVSLAGLYWVLSKLLRGATPGTTFSEEQASDPGRESTAISKYRGIETLGRLSALVDVPDHTALLKRPLLEELAMADRILRSEGVLDGYGSISVRDDSNQNCIFLAGPEIGEYDLNGKSMSGDLAAGHPDRFLHCEIYRARPDVMAIVHSQASELIPFAASSVPLLPVLEMANFLVSGVPVFESRSVGAVNDEAMRGRAIGQAVAGALGDKTAILMRGRGAVVVAPSLHIAVGRAYFMNLNARLQAQSILLGGTVHYLEPSDPPPPTTEFERAWEYWKQRAIV